MKELSIEEKARAYDEAIKYAHYLINECCKKGTNGSFHRADLQRMFPELEESDDERIRKNLIWGFKNLPEETFASISISNIITWLEKQGGHNNFIDKIQVGDKVTRNEDGMLVNLSQLDRVAKKDEKQGEQKSIDDLTPQEAMDIAVAKCFEEGEQKSADKVEPKFKVGDEIKTANEESLIITKIDEKGYWSEDLFICGFNEECIWDLVEQKPAWSEEDEAMINNLYRVIDEQIVISGDTRRMFCSWLKSLKDRVQPKQEWSEEDERMYRGLHNLIYSTPYCDSRKELSDWLESLKERVQPKQEWSDDDERGRKQVVDLLEGWLSTFKETCYAEDCKCGIAWLKSLRPQKQWKPSSEQMEALAWALSLAKNCGEECAFDLRTLYEQLNKLKGK